MAYAVPDYGKSEVNRAGEIISGRRASSALELGLAYHILTNWRAAHAYPINTFQALLRLKLKAIDSDAIVAQRLKRLPSIVSKLQRNDTMKLARMQDIGGLRAILPTVSKVRRLEDGYRNARFAHELVNSKDYIDSPKADGYRGIHLIYRYSNARAPAAYEGLSLELQLRTRLQHAWATAVETMGTFLGQALKAGQGDPSWRRFFSAASAAFSVLERSPRVPGFEGLSGLDIYRRVAAEEDDLKVLDKLNGFAVAAEQITKADGSGTYHLVILDARERTVRIVPYSIAKLDEANNAYAAIEARANAGEEIEAVLVSAGPIEALKKAYPNYFLDTQGFILQIRRVIKLARLEEE